MVWLVDCWEALCYTHGHFMVDMVVLVTQPIQSIHAAGLDIRFITKSNKQTKGSKPDGLLPYGLTDICLCDLMLVHELQGQFIEFIGLLNIADMSAMLQNHQVGAFISVKVFC